MSLLLCPNPDQVPVQWIFSRQDLLETPSVLSGAWNPSTERAERAKGIDKIIRAVDYLRVGRHIASTAAVFFHRFYMRRSLPPSPDNQEFQAYEISATCVYLACKSEESPRKIRDVVEAVMGSHEKNPEGIKYFELKDFRRWADKSKPGEYERSSHRWIKTILRNEDSLLEALCFDLIIEHPHKALMESAAYLGVEKKLTQVAWALLGDLILDPIYIILDPPVLAAGAFLKACRLMNRNPDDYEAEVGDVENVVGTRKWLEVFDVDMEEAEDAVASIEDSLIFLTEVLGSSKHTSSSYSTPRHQSKGFGSQPNSQSSQNTPSHNAFTKKPNSNGDNTPNSGFGSPNPTSITKPPSSNKAFPNLTPGFGNVKSSNLSNEVSTNDGETISKDGDVTPGLKSPDFSQIHDEKQDPNHLSSASLSNPFEDGEADSNLNQRPKSRRGTGDNESQAPAFSTLSTINHDSDEKEEKKDGDGMDVDPSNSKDDASKDQSVEKPQEEEETFYRLESPKLD